MENVCLIYVIAVLLCGACGSKTEDTKAENPKKKEPAQVWEKENGQEAQARDKTHPASTSDSPAPPDATQTADADAAKHCQGDPNPCVTDTLFEILGMLQEYSGRRLSDEQVEFFFYNESKAAAAFAATIVAYEKEVGISFAVRQIEGDRIEFRSKSLSRLLNSFYKKAENRSWYTVNRASLDSATPARKRRFVAGVYKRFGVSSPKRQSLVRVVNAFEKAETVAHVLKTLGCPEAAVYTTPTIPVSCYVRFVPTKELKALLQIEMVLTESELKEAHPNISPGVARIPL